MKAKDLIKRLCIAGLVEGSVHSGDSIKKANYKVLEGRVSSKKEYFYMFRQIGYNDYTAKVETNHGSIVYLYAL